ncbi:MAG: TIR domain-containing protein, partial [Verrucomicrobiales bacterium]|nr:TIR domain-containing protein [Verrucomicrobiales bacterium]
MNLSHTQYDAFISYSRGADGRTAAQLQRALHRIATPWYRLRGMRVFRDETDLTVSPEGWPSIQRALDQSRFLVLLASTRAAQAPWVAKEVEHWLQGHPPDTVMIAITDGDIAWDPDANDFDWGRTTSLPKAL